MFVIGDNTYSFKEIKEILLDRKSDIEEVMFTGKDEDFIEAVTFRVLTWYGFDFGIDFKVSSFKHRISTISISTKRDLRKIVPFIREKLGLEIKMRYDAYPADFLDEEMNITKRNVKKKEACDHPHCDNTLGKIYFGELSGKILKKSFCSRDCLNDFYDRNLEMELSNPKLKELREGIKELKDMIPHKITTDDLCSDCERLQENMKECDYNGELIPANPTAPACRRFKRKGGKKNNDQ